MDDIALRTLLRRFRADVMFWILPMIFRPWSKFAVRNVYRFGRAPLPRLAAPLDSWA